MLSKCCHAGACFLEMWRLSFKAVTLHRSLKREVGIRELHDQLSRYVRYVSDGGEVVVTMRGRRVARLSPVEGGDPLAELRERGLVAEPAGDWKPRRTGRPRPAAAVSELVGEQRR
jgi:prevent-host-death family protein